MPRQEEEFADFVANTQQTGNLENRRALTDDELLDWARSLPNPFVEDEPSVSKSASVGVIGIGVGNYGITTASSETPELNTFGMSACVAVGIIDDATNTIALAHFSTSNVPWSLSTIYEDLFPDVSESDRLSAMKRTRVIIRGGTLEPRLPESRWMLLTILRFVYEHDLNVAGVINHEDGIHYNGFSIRAQDGGIVPNVACFTIASGEYLGISDRQIVRSFNGRIPLKDSNNP